MKSFICFIYLLLFANFIFAQNAKPEDANILIKNSIEKAKKENKNIFVKFSANWCGWCHKMDAAMQDSSTIELFNKQYVIVIIDVEESAKKYLENKGGAVIMKKYGGEKQGLPYWVVLNKNGKLIANSKLKDENIPINKNEGDNCGCPSETNEINYFIRVLKSTSTLSTNELTTIKKRFEKIKLQ